MKAMAIVVAMMVSMLVAKVLLGVASSHPNSIPNPQQSRPDLLNNVWRSMTTWDTMPKMANNAQS